MAATPRYDVHSDVNTDPIDVRKLPTDAHVARVTPRDPQRDGPKVEFMICRQCEKSIPGRTHPTGLCTACRDELERERMPLPPGPPEPAPAPIPPGGDPLLKPTRMTASTNPPASVTAQVTMRRETDPPGEWKPPHPLNAKQKSIVTELQTERTRCLQEQARLSKLVSAIDVVLEMYRG